MKTITYTNKQGLELKINKFARGIQPYLQQWRPHLLLHHDGTQDHPTEKRDDQEMGSQCKRQV